jgi:hypothetical protein
MSSDRSLTAETNRVARNSGGAGKSCFVIGPIGDRHAPVGSSPRQAYEDAIQVFESVIQAACSRFGIEPVRSDNIDNPGEIPEQVFELLRDADVVIADLTGGNPNVMYELGLRHGQGGCVVQIGEYERLPFDVSVIRTIRFVRTEGGLIAARRELEAALREALNGNCPPVTATRVMRGQSGTDVLPPADQTPPPEDVAEEEPGFIEILAEMEQAMPRFSERLQQQTAVLEKLAVIGREGTAEIQTSDTRGEGFAGRTVVAASIAQRLNAEADKLEPIIESALRDLDAIDKGVSYVLDQVELDPARLPELGEFPKQIGRFADVSTTAVSGSITTARQFEQLGAAHRVLRPPTRRLSTALKRTSAYAEVPSRWKARLDALSEAQGTIETPEEEARA